MTILGTLAVKLEAMTASFEKDMNRASETVKSYSKGIEAATAVAGAAFAGLTGVIALATKELGEAREAENRLKAVAGITGINVETVKAYAAALQKVTTFGDDATISASATLASFGATESQLLTLMPRMQDLAAFMGTDLDSAAMILGKAMTGTGAALSRAGISLTDVQEELLKTGTQEQRVALLTDLLGSKFGGMAQAMAQTATGAFTQLRTAFGNVLEELGVAVEVPLLTIFRALTEAVQWVADGFASLSPTWKEVVGIGVLVATAVAGVATAAGGLALVLPTLIAGFTAMWPVIAPLPLMFAVLALKLAAVVLAIALVRKAWVDDLGGIRTFVMKWVNTIGEWWTSLVNNMIAEWYFFRDDFLNVLKSLASNPAIVGLVGVISEDWGNALIEFNESGEDMGKALARVWKGIGSDAGSTLDSLKKTAGVTIDYVIDAFKELAASVGFDLGAVKGKLAELSTVAAPGGAVGGAAGGAATGELEGPPAELANAGIAGTQRIADEGTSIMASIGQSAISKLGTLGEVAQSALQGFSQGGPIGAIIAVIADLLMRTKGFAETVQSLNGMMDGIIDAIGPLTEAGTLLTDMIVESMQPVLEKLKSIFEVLNKNAITPLFRALGALNAAIMPIIEVLLAVLQPVIEVLGFVIRGVAIVIGAIAVAIGWVVNAVIDVISEILNVVAGVADIFGAGGEVRKFRDSIRESRIDLDDLTQALTDTVLGTEYSTDATEEQAEANEEAAASVRELDTSANEAATTIQEVNEALTNIPQGFKIAAARFEAIGDTFAPGGASMLGVGGAGASMVTTIENVFLQTDDPEAFLNKLQNAAAWRNFAGTGTPIDTPPDPYKR